MYKKCIVSVLAFICVCGLLTAEVSEMLKNIDYSRESDNSYRLDLSGFTKIDIDDGLCDVVLTQGNEYRVVIDAVYAERAEIRQDGRSIRFGHPRFSGMFRKRGKISITCPELEKLSVSGRSSLRLAGSWHFSDISMDFSGSTEIMLETIRSDELDIESSGSSSIDAQSIECQELDFESSGNSKAAFTSIQTDAVRFDCSGSGKITIDTIACAKLEFGGAGSCSIVCSAGYADAVKIRAAGSQRAEFQNIQAKTAEIKASGSCTVYLNVSGYISGELSGSTSIRYLGNPQISVSSSGSASVKPLS